jgi:hypothetical protein
VQRYNQRRPHRGLELRVPESLAPVEEADGGMIEFSYPTHYSG